MAREVRERQDIIPVLGEVFREFGYSGASLSEISRRTGLGKGSLYHFFPNGKREMAAAVLADIAGWFDTNLFVPLRESEDPAQGISDMFHSVQRYFHSGNRVCLIGVFALDETRDLFAEEISGYFHAWARALEKSLKRNGLSGARARAKAEEIISGIQGALVLARSYNDAAVFVRALGRLKRSALGDY